MKTVEKFNAMVHEGVDRQYGRGDNAYDRFFGDPSSRYVKNPCLGTIEQEPFYACRIFPGDLGTKGGIVTDIHARALDKDGMVIPNLYAFGNSSASVMGREYCGPGSTLGPALTFAYLAVDHIIKS
jgi:3-oxosteroid 1-dehydrogenase